MDSQTSRFEVEISKQMKRLPVQFFSTLVDKVNRFIEEGRDVINLGQGNPDLPTPSHIVRSLQEAAENPLNHRYPPFSGRRELKEAVSQWYRNEHGVDLDPDEEVAILFGTKTGLIQISAILLNPGDIALVPDPGYSDYKSGISIAGAKMVPMPLLKENAYLPDLSIQSNRCLRPCCFLQ
jgi:aminotransferase